MKKEEGKWHGDNYDFGWFKGLDLDQEILRLVYISMLLSVDDGVGDTWWAVHREAVTEFEGEVYTVQAAEHTAMGERRVYVWQEGKEIWYFV